MATYAPEIIADCNESLALALQEYLLAKRGREEAMAHFGRAEYQLSITAHKAAMAIGAVGDKIVCGSYLIELLDNQKLQITEIGVVPMRAPPK